jgi:hypothetical protein
MEGLKQSSMELVKVYHSVGKAVNAAHDLKPEHIFYHTSEESFKDAIKHER